MSLVTATIKRDLLLAARNAGEWQPAIMAAFRGPDPVCKIAGGVFGWRPCWPRCCHWMPCIKPMLKTARWEQWLASGNLCTPWRWAPKALVHWCISGLPLTLMAPVLGLILNMPDEAYAALLSLLIGTPVLSLLGAVGAALTAGVRSGGLLLSLLILPLYIPVLIFAASAVYHAGIGMDYNGQLGFLGALLALALCLTPFAASAALKLNLSR